MKFKIGDLCAAYLPYGATNTSWILVRVERKEPRGAYIVRDIYDEDGHDGLYRVSSKRMAVFPANSKVYEPEERILALWRDEASQEWSTMFYEAIVLQANRGSTIKLQYKGAVDVVSVGYERVTRFPADFDESAEAACIEFEQFSTEEPKSTPLDEQPEVQYPPIKPNADNKVPTAPTQHVSFTFEPPVIQNQLEIKKLTDEDFTAMAGKPAPYRRMETEPDFPLIKALQDPDLIPKEFPHVTSSGIVAVPHTQRSEAPSAILSKDINAGKLSRILVAWRNGYIQ